MAKFFGTPQGVHVGQQFIDRRDLHEASVHRPLQAGISGTKAEGADSIVLSGGYKDDLDFGDYILYTGHGGKDPNSSSQIANQSPDDAGNAGLITSMLLGLPVRVIRGSRFKSEFSPPAGFRYAGLYTVTDWNPALGKDGFTIIQFRLDRIPEQDPYLASTPTVPDPAFATTTVSRRIRDSAIAREVKELYEFHCQVCSTAIEIFEGRFYAEGAHVRPLGRPHLGADSLDNLLCLCANHHAQLDKGGLFILNDMTLQDRMGLAVGALDFKKKHSLLPENAEYHRAFWTKVG
jgi:putative restriction endonuclease